MKKVLLLNIFPITVGYSVFAILLTIFTNVPKVGQQIQNIWYIPFSIFTLYVFYIILKDYRLIKQNNSTSDEIPPKNTETGTVLVPVFINT